MEPLPCAQGFTQPGEPQTGAANTEGEAQSQSRLVRGSSRRLSKAREGLAGFLEQEPDKAFTTLLTNEEKQNHVPHEGTQPRQGGLFQNFKNFVVTRIRTPEAGIQAHLSSTGRHRGRATLGSTSTPSFLPPHPNPPAFPTVGLKDKHRLKEFQLKASFLPFLSRSYFWTSCFLPKTPQGYTFHSLSLPLPFRSAQHLSLSFF